MSLKRDQWIDMWEAVMRIEHIVDEFIAPQYTHQRHAAKKDLKEIQKLIQSVIGQMK